LSPCSIVQVTSCCDLQSPAITIDECDARSVKFAVLLTVLIFAAAAE
jgi:hypothetical protein